MPYLISTLHLSLFETQPSPSPSPSSSQVHLSICVYLLDANAFAPQKLEHLVHLFVPPDPAAWHSRRTSPVKGIVASARCRVGPWMKLAPLFPLSSCRPSLLYSVAHLLTCPFLDTFILHSPSSEGPSVGYCNQLMAVTPLPDSDCFRQWPTSTTCLSSSSASSPRT